MQKDHLSASQIHAESEVPAKHTGAESPPQSFNSRGKMIAVTLAALVGGLFGGIGIMNLHEVFPYSEEAVEILSRDQRSDEQAMRLEELIVARWRKNAMASYAFCGTMIAGAVGLASGMVKRPKPGAAVGLGAGVVLGAVGGAIGAILNVWTFELMVANEFSRLRIGMWTQMAAFVPIGAFTGLAAALATTAKHPALLRLALLGAVGAFLAGFLYAPLVSVLFPNDKIELPIPMGNAARLAWGALLAVIIGAIIGNDLSGASDRKDRLEATEES